MKITISLLVVLCSGISLSLDHALGQVSNLDSIRILDRGLTFASGMIEKTSPIDGTVNQITGDNQATGNRMLLGKGDSLYLKLDNPGDVAVGDLFTVYRRVRKVFHPVREESIPPFFLPSLTHHHTTDYLRWFCNTHHPEVNFDDAFQTGRPGVYARYQERFGFEYADEVPKILLEYLKAALTKRGYRLSFE